MSIQLEGGEHPVQMTARTNDRGRLAKIEMRISAASFFDAQRTSHSCISPLLSWWSFRCDVAIDVGGVHLVEEATGVTRWVGGVLGQPKPFINETGYWSKEEHRPLFAAYREGLIAVNPFYQVLCFYRVIEGVTKLRNVRREALIAAGQSYRAPDERIPSSYESLAESSFIERESFESHLGQKFTKVIEDMRATVRNALAHLDPTGNDLVPDNFDDMIRVEKALPVVAYIARQMLTKEINSDPDYGVTPHL